jgi:hypothetical protein
MTGDVASASGDVRDDDRRLDIISAELDAEIASYVSRDSAMQQRATVLIGAASIVGALQVDTALGWTTVVSLILSFLAAVAGVVVVFPRTGDALDIRTMRDGLVKMTLQAGRAKLVDTKLEILEADERWLLVRGKFARAGFIALSLSIAVATIAVLSPAAPDSEPTHSQSAAVHHD